MQRLFFDVITQFLLQSFSPQHSFILGTFDQRWCSKSFVIQREQGRKRLKINQLIKYKSQHRTCESLEAKQKSMKIILIILGIGLILFGIFFTFGILLSSFKENDNTGFYDLFYSFTIIGIGTFCIFKGVKHKVKNEIYQQFCFNFQRRFAILVQYNSTILIVFLLHFQARPTSW